MATMWAEVNEKSISECCGSRKRQELSAVGQGGEGDCIHVFCRVKGENTVTVYMDTVVVEWRRQLYV